MTVEAITIAILCLYLPYLTASPYEAGDYALALAPAVLWAGLYFGLEIRISEALWLPVSCIALLLCASVIVSGRPDIAVKSAMRTYGAIMIGFMITNGDWALMIAGVVHSIVQAVTSTAPGKKRLDKHVPTGGGLTGNANMTGAFLLLCLFASMSIGAWLPAIVILAGLYFSKCKAAFAGLIAGSCMFFVLTFNWWPIVGLALLFVFAFGATMDFSRIGLLTFYQRLEHWKMLLRLINWRVLLIGLGPDVLRTQSSIQFDRYSGDNSAVRWSRSHSDPLQMLFDGGLALPLLHLLVAATAILLAVDGGNYYIAAGIVASLVNGLAFHTQQETHTMVAFWVLVGAA